MEHGASPALFLPRFRKCLMAASVRRDAAVIALVAIAHATSHIFHLLLPPLFPFLMSEFGFGFTEAGFLMTVFFSVSGVGQAFAGIAVDRYGARRILMAGVAMLACSGLVLAVADNFAMLVFAVLLAGMGNAIFHPADFSLLNKKVSPDRLGHAFSMHGLAGSLGWAMGAALSGTALVWWGWRMAGIVAAVIAVLVLLALFIAKPILEEPPPRVGDGRTAVGKATFAFLGFPVVWLAFGFFLLVTAAFGGLQSFSAPILGDLYGLTPAVAVAALTAYLLGAAGGTLAGGFVAGRVAQHDRLVARSLAIAAAFAVILAAGVLPPWAVMPLMVCIGLGVGLAGPSRDLLVRRAAIETASAGAAPGSGANSPAFGRIYGFVYSGLDVGLAVGPLVFGVLLDAGGKAYVLPGIALLQILAVLTVLNMGRRMRPVAVA